MIHAAFLSLFLLTEVPYDPNIQGMPDVVDKTKLKRAPYVPIKASPVATLPANNAPIQIQVNGNAPVQVHFNVAGGGGVVVMGGGFLVNGKSSQPAPPAEPGLPTLHWKNGETISGDIVTATTSTLTWKTPLFEDPLQLDLQVLDRIDWTQAPVQSADPFGIALRDGSFIYGDLVSIGADSISIRSAHHGDTVLKRSEVLSARRIRHGSLLFSGPTGNVGWQLMATQQDGSVTSNQNSPAVSTPLVTGPGGELQIKSWNRAGLLGLQVPDLVDVEMRVRSSMRPEFLLSLGGDVHQSLRVETWDDQLVLAVGNEFKAIRQIGDHEREVALRICWDLKAQKCSVFSSAGELITEWQVPGSLSSPAPGLILQNKGLDLSLDLLRVRTWNGKPPAKIGQKQSHVELADGRSIGGEIVAGPPGSIMVQTPGQTAAASFALGDVDAVVLSSDPPQNAGPGTSLSYADGTVIFGRLASIADGRAVVTTSFTKDPLLSKIDGLRELLLSPPAVAAPASSLDNQDKICIQDTTLHGKLVGEGDNRPRWTPIGGVASARPSKTLPSEITRVCPADTGPGDPALFYLSSGDVLSGNLRSLDRSGAEFESPLMEARKLPAGELDAIQFAAPTRINVQGFADAGWQIVKGDEKTVRRENDAIEMEPGTAIAYPSLMQSSEIRFKYSSPGFSSTRLRMFCAGTDRAHSMNLLLGNTGNQFIAGQEITEGQFENQAQIRTTPGEAVAVRIRIGSNQLELFLNDVSVLQLPFDPSKCAGSGLMIEPASIWGNGSFPISLSGFSATSVPGRTWLPEISSDIRKQVLTVPRFQKDDPPRHLLLAANGDVLRGEIEAATDSHFGFRSGLEQINVPRDRVKAVIWLKPPVENPAPAADENSPPNPLDKRIEQRAMFGAIGLKGLISFLKRQDPNLNFKTPDTYDARRIRMQFGGQTIGEELEKICSMFNMRYRREKDGTIVIEPAGQTAAEFPRKSYWLKPDAIPTTAALQEFLTSKGIAFPDGSSANWQAASGLLSMTNTPENQDKLAALLASDFGGSLGSPTHWLLLTNGARLALAVDKFEPDFITGRNPAYGACKVPMAQVYIIRNTAPDPTTTIKMLEDWRLVAAPEPVIPGAGGEDSPLLGKDAVTFKLPLLAGGDFNLDAQKGQVVVLDFWATWCGPCVKSLPGLIGAMSSFPADRVKLIGVNQGESPEQVKRFMETRGLKFTVAMDADQSVAQKYGVDAIPHTVIVGPDGKVAWMQTGYNPDGEAEASDAVKKLLEPPSPAPAPAKSPAQ